MTDPFTVAFWIGSPAVLVGAVISVRKIGGAVIGFFKRIAALAALAEHELNHNSGTSTKDAAFAAANAAAEAVSQNNRSAERLDALHDQFSEFLIQYPKDQSALWQAIERRAS